MKLTFLNFREYLFYVNKNVDWIDSITPAEAAELLGITRQRMLQLIESGEIDAAYIMREKFTKKDTSNSSHVFLKRQDVVLMLRQSMAKRGNPSKFFHKRFQANPEKLMKEFRNSLSGSLFLGTSHMHDFITSTFEINKAIVDTTGSRGFESLREMINNCKKQNIVPEPMLVSVNDGMFLPATLLSDGLWSKQYQSLLHLSEKSPAPLQQWLFEGFFNWAPSFEFNPPISSFFVKETKNSYPYLIGQYGQNDEAFSLPVLISSNRKNNIEIIAETLTKKYAFPATIRGVLTHKSHLPEQEKTILNDNNDYCLKVSTDDHIVKPELSRDGEIYGSYLWVCLGDIALPATLDNSFFIWEHTNLANQDSIAFSLDSLEHKIEYIRKQNKDKNLVLLHKSMSLVNGNPEYEPEKFYDFLLRKDLIAKQEHDETIKIVGAEVK